MTVAEISEMLEGVFEGDADKEINSVGKIESARPDQITFIANSLYEKFYSQTNAGAILVSENFEIKSKRDDICVIRVQDPYRGFLLLLEKFEDDDDELYEGISDNCSIGKDVYLGNDIFVGDFTVINDNCKIGNNTQIHSNCTIDRNVSIGNNVIIYPNVTVYKGCIIGDNCIIHSGCVIGSDGFGQVKQTDGSYKKLPQIGIVRISDNVEIGSNSSIDRATIGETFIGKGVKIDNMVQIAHNVSIDENTVIAGQVGIAGSAKIGKRVMIGGQSGIVGHITICDDVIIGASVGVSKSIEKPGIYTGYRGKPHRENLRQEANISRLDDIVEKLKILEKLIHRGE